MWRFVKLNRVMVSGERICMSRKIRIARYSLVDESILNELTSSSPSEEPDAKSVS